MVSRVLSIVGGTQSLDHCWTGVEHRDQCSADDWNKWGQGRGLWSLSTPSRFPLRYASSVLDGCIFLRRWAYSSINRWTLSMANKRAGRIRHHRWANCSITAVIRFLPVRPRQSKDASPISSHLLVFVTIACCCSVQLGVYPWLMFWACMFSFFAFYCAHWQTYVSGKLKFGK